MQQRQQTLLPLRRQRSLHPDMVQQEQQPPRQEQQEQQPPDQQQQPQQHPLRSEHPEQQQPAASTYTVPASLVAAVLCAARAGKATGLLPHIAAWEKVVEEKVADARQAIADVAAVEAPTAAVGRDVAVVQMALSQLSPEERPGSVGKALEAALLGAQQCSFLPPQAALLVSDHSGRWGHISTDQLITSGFFGPYWDKVTRAFGLSMAQIVLQRDAAQLDPLSHVELRQPDPMPAASAAVPPKKKPESKLLRDRLTTLCGHLITFLKERGLGGDLCHHNDVKLCHVADGNLFCTATQRHIDNNKIEVLEDGSLKPTLGFRSCHRVRLELGDNFNGLPVVAYSSCASFTTAAYTALIKALTKDDCPFLEPFRAALPGSLVASADQFTTASAEPQLVPPPRLANAAGAELAARAAARIAAASAPADPPSSAPPQGVLMKDGRAVVRCDEPTFEQLQWANGHNKGSTRGATMGKQLAVSRAGSQAVVAWVDLWAALRKAGGYHLVLAQNNMFSVLRTLPGWDTASVAALRGAEQSAATWLLPLYGWGKDEELGTFTADGMAAALKDAIDLGVLLEQGGCIKLAAHRIGGVASRRTVLLAMQASQIELPDFDMISGGKHGAAVTVQHFCAYLSDAGGVEKVRTDNSAAESLAAACSWEGSAARLRTAVRNAVERLKTLWPDDELAEQEGAEQEGMGQEGVEPEQPDAGLLPPDLLAMLAAIQPEQQLPEPELPPWLQPSAGSLAPGWVPAASTPVPFLAAATTPFGTAGAADLIAQLAQLPPLPFLLAVPSDAAAQGIDGSHPEKRRRTGR